MKSRGRLVVNPDMSVPGVEGVWAVGDCAAVINEADRKVCPPTAQFAEAQARQLAANIDRKSTRLNSSHSQISYAVLCLKKQKRVHRPTNSPGASGRGYLPAKDA